MECVGDQSLDDLVAFVSVNSGRRGVPPEMYRCVFSEMAAFQCMPQNEGTALGAKFVNRAYSQMVEEMMRGGFMKRFSVESGATPLAAHARFCQISALHLPHGSRRKRLL
jgi:hypothetical protein